VDLATEPRSAETPEVSEELKKSDCSNAFTRNLSTRSCLLLNFFTYKIFRLFFVEDL